MDILPKNITIKPGETVSPSKSGAGFKVPSFGKPNAISLEKKIEEARWPFILGLSIFALVILIWLGLFFYNKSLDIKAKDLDKKLSDLQSEGNRASLEKILDLSNGLKQAGGLLDSHIYSSNAFRLIEELTLPNLQWLSFNLDIDSGKATMTGRTQSYNALARQILIFENDMDKRISKINTSNISLDHNGGVGFSMDIVLSKETLSKFTKQQ